MSLTPLAANPRACTRSSPAASSRRRTSGFDGRGIRSILADRSLIFICQRACFAALVALTVELILRNVVQLDTEPSREQSADILTALGFPVMTSAPNYRPRTSVV